MPQGKLRIELDLPGIYFLFGEDEDGAKPVVYIGQTEDARKRLDSHNKTKTFWKTAIFCVSKTQNFTQAHIRYLEWYCMQRAKEIARYTLDNGQVPENSTYVPEPMEAELLDVFETISTLVSTLGYPAFEPLVRNVSTSPRFFCRSRGCDASGELVEDGFVVFQRSKSRSIRQHQCPMRSATAAEACLTPVLFKRRMDSMFTNKITFSHRRVTRQRPCSGHLQMDGANGRTRAGEHSAKSIATQVTTSGQMATEF